MKTRVSICLTAILVGPISFCMSAQDAFLRGYNAEQQKNDTEALQFYDKALEIDGAYVKAYNNKALVFYRQGKFEEALATIEKAIAVNPKYASGHLNRGLILEAKGDIPGALASFETAAQLDPAFPTAQFNAGNMLLRRGQAAKAVPYLEKAHALAPEDPEISVTYGQALLRTGAMVKAKEQFAAVLKKNPGDDGALSGMVTIFNAAGSFEVALTYAQALINAQPGCPSCLSMAGSIMIELKKYKEAAEIYERAVKIAPADPMLRYNLGFLHYLMKNKEPAVRELEEYLKLRGKEKDETTEKVKKMVEAMKKAK